tara:strand:- start:235 stop:666 length:432 start_codon:yes stop_codon:yes gene_type:complete
MAKATQINLDTAQRVDIICRKGDTFSLRLTLTTSDTPPVAAFQDTDVFRLEVRETDTGELVQNADGTDFFVQVEASSSDETAGFIDLTVSAATMKTMPSGLYAYDVEQKVVNDSEGETLDTPTVATLIYGTLKVNEDVSITAA